MVNEPLAISGPQKRIVLGLEYDGSVFSGWQKQASPAQNTIQENLEHALSQVADERISTVCAGRTDSGVHATCQVIHFDTTIDRGENAWTRGVNSLLPKGVRVTWAKNVDPEFHARFTAQARRYCYVIQSSRIEPAIFSGKVTHVRRELDVAAMHRSAQALLGEQDFSAFRAAGCQSNNPHRNVSSVAVTACNGLIVIDICANAFLQHMVRNITGSLLDVGAGIESECWIAELLLGRDRSKAGATAPSDGLYLVAVKYPDAYQVNSGPKFPLIISAYQ